MGFKLVGAVVGEEVRFVCGGCGRVEGLEF